MFNQCTVIGTYQKYKKMAFSAQLKTFEFSIKNTGKLLTDSEKGEFSKRDFCHKQCLMTVVKRNIFKDLTAT